LAKACAALAVAGGIGVSAPSLLAATAAGTQIKNLATVTYEDAAGNQYSAQSNEAVITVAQVYSATIGVDVDATAAAGQTVYLPYVLTNTGNGNDVFDLVAANGITGGDTIDSPNLTVYIDSNGNGVPDAGENAVTSVALDAADIANLVVAVVVPGTAAAGQTLGITLTAQAQAGTGAGVASSVTDLTAGGGRDGLDGTNESLITVTDDAVLVTTKTSVHDVANNRISYTLTVRNNGSRAARNVVLFDGLPAGTTLVTSGVSGLLAANGDTLNTAGVISESSISDSPFDLNADGDTNDADEASLGLDLNNDGDTADAAVQGLYAVDSELPPSTSVSMTFTVSYDPNVLGGGYQVVNQGHAAGDTDEVAGTDSLVSSNVVQDAIDAVYGVTIADTGAAGAPGANDGGDDDAIANDDQFVDQAATGAVVVFDYVITNNGNAPDIFELSTDPGNFPAGTVFTWYDASGAVQLSDTNGSGVDSGVLQGLESRTYTLKATLPTSASGDAPLPAAEYQATVTATSANDPSVPAAKESDSAFASLGTIIEAVVDLHNSPTGTGPDEDPVGAAPYTVTTTYVGQTGTQVTIPLYIDNESDGGDSFVLQAGGSYDGTALGALPAGWIVEFFLGNGSGTATGSAITTTPVIPGGAAGQDFEILAVVSIPSDATLAVNDYDFDRDGDGTTDPLDGNADGDDDYPIFFRVSSSNTGASDVKLDAIDVDASRQLSLITPSQLQVEPGGTVDYDHTLANNGNVSETVELSSANSQPGFTNAVQIDTDGDGAPDTALVALVPGDITVQQGDGTDVVVTVTDVDGDGNPEFALEPGYSLPLFATVFAPSNAAPGTVDLLTIDAVNLDAGGPSVQLVDQTTVINGQVKILKTVAVDAACDGAADGPFAAVQNTGVAPGECAIWRVSATNSGTADANNVVVNDSVTAFSTFESGSLRYCLGSSCSPAPVTDAADTDEGTLAGSNIVFYVGTGPSPASGEGGVLVGGQVAIVEFAVKID